MVLLGTKILARLLVVHGSSYMSKFTSKTGGFVIMRNRLKRWWNVGPLWPICFCILFGKDVAKVQFEGPLELFALLEAFSRDDKTKVVYPDVLPVIAAMLKAGVGTVVADISGDDSKDGKGKGKEATLDVHKHVRRRSLSLNGQPGELEIISRHSRQFPNGPSCRKPNFWKKNGRTDKNVASINTVCCSPAINMSCIP